MCAAPRAAPTSTRSASCPETAGDDPPGDATDWSSMRAPVMGQPDLPPAGPDARLRVVALLASGGRCVCDLQEKVPVVANLLSYHLRVSCDAGLVTATRRGRWVDYRLDGDGFAALWAQVSAAGVPPPGEQVTAESRGRRPDRAAAARLLRDHVVRRVLGQPPTAPALPAHRRARVFCGQQRLRAGDRGRDRGVRRDRAAARASRSLPPCSHQLRRRSAIAPATILRWYPPPSDDGGNDGQTTDK
jgi:ArsR family transcriptional regulator